MHLAGFDGEATDRENDPAYPKEDPAESGIADMDGVNGAIASRVPPLRHEGGSMKREFPDLAANDLLTGCSRRSAMVNADTAAPIEAHRLAVSQKQPDMVLWLARTTIILSTTRTVERSSSTIWPSFRKRHGHRRRVSREQQLDINHRAIGWHSVCNA